MHKGIIKELAEKYNESQKVIEIMMQIGIKEGYSIKDTSKIIEEFYNSKINL